MSNFEPTLEQVAAIDCLDNHAAITAGAGAGKTKVLIHRILQIVLTQRAEFRQIAAITFTEKAASEMKVKLRKEAKAQMKKSPQFKDELKEVSSTHISTIHSFCSSIIKRFALNVNLTPDYQILLEDEAFRLLRKSINKVLEDLEDQSQVLVRFRAENYNLVEDLAFTYNKIREFGFTVEEAFILTTNKFNEATLLAKEALNDYIKALDKAYIWKESLSGKAKTAKFVTLVLKNWPVIRPFFFKLQADEELTQDEKIQLIDYLGLIKARDTINSFFGEDVQKAVKQGMLVIPFLFTKSDAKELVEGFNTLLTFIDKHYLELKQDKHALDFIDLQLKALAILKKPQAKKELLRELRYIMIDEYQDTNYLQQRIIDELWQDNLNLFIVGDPKQSIYRFRGSEVALFSKTTKEILAKNGKKVSLSYNFRSEKDLIDFYNSYFELLMPGDKQKSYAIGYEKIQTKKTDSGKCFQIIACPYDYKLEEKIHPRRWQAKAIARLIFEAVNCKENEQVQYGDFAVLFHKRSAGLAELEEELAQAKIPFVSGMGLDFFAREEIRDCLALLNFLNTPLDELSLAAVLKGPFFNQDEKVLYSLFQKAKENETSLYGAILLFGGNDNFVQREKDAHGILESKGEEFSELAKQLARLRIEYGYKSLALLLTELIQNAQFDLILQGQLMGEERAANLEKLLELITTQDTNGLSNSEIVEYLNVVKEAGTADAEVVTESTDRVTIMTVHAAKGLEFKKVILAGINFSQRSLPEPIMTFDKEQGLIVGLLNYNDGIKVKCTDPRFYISRERIKDEEEYEKQRLFYVAATRAMTDLYLVVAGKFLTKNFKTANPILKLFMWDQEKVSFQSYQTKYYPYEYAFVTASKKEMLMPQGKLDKVFIRPNYRALSPTALVQFRICPRLFYLEQRLKVPPIKELLINEEADIEQDAVVDFDGQAIGTVLHHIFAEAKDLKEAESIFEKANLPQVYYRILPHYFASRFYNRGQSEVPISLYLPEKRLRFIGIIDRVFWEKERITVIDFKTHCQVDFALKAKEYELQLAVYAKALKERFNKPVEALIYFPYPDKIYPVELDAAEVLLGRVLDDINRVLDNKILPKAKYKENCLANCPYLTLCHRE